MILGITCRSYTGVTPQFRFPGRHCNLTLSELAAFRKKNSWACSNGFCALSHLTVRHQQFLGEVL